MTSYDLTTAFEREYSYLLTEGLFITGVHGEYPNENTDGGLSISISHSLKPEDEIFPEHCHLSVMHPFIFDNRKIPKVFMGVRVLNVVRADTMPSELEEIVYDPAGFEMNYTPGQYFSYIKENMDLIRDTLKEHDMSLEDMLDAICFGDFNKFQQEFDEERIKRIIQ
ncbi:MAG: hypothetical protein KBC43_07280 [Bacteroidales bacterium]|nr:hypothetical protein [Bacteroidales bacterium]